MAQYKVVSDRLADHKCDEVVDGKVLGDSVTWLLKAGHIIEVNGKAAKNDEVTKD